MASKWWTLLAVCLAIFMLLLDITIVNVALPEIRRDLGSSFTDLQWVVDAYALALAALLLATGSLGDLLGRRRIFVLGILLFMLASLLCGLASTPMMLNLARGLQGVGGAMMFATSLALIAQEFPPDERGTAFGLWGATTGFAVAVGPLAGGLLTEGLGWEWIFFVNIPIGLVTAAMTLARVPEGERDPSAKIDWPGVVTFSGALFCLVLALIEGNEQGWTSALVLGLLTASVVLLAAFVVIERRSAQPMLDLSLFAKPAFTGAQIVAFSLHASIFSMFLYLTLYLQNILGYSALEAGLRFLPVSLLVLSRRARGREARRATAGARLPRSRPDHGRRRAPAHGRNRALRRLDHAAGRLHRRRHRHRAGQPAAGHGGHRSGRAAQKRRGVGHQQHVPPGGHGHGNRRAGRDLPGPRQPTSWATPWPGTPLPGGGRGRAGRGGDLRWCGGGRPGRPARRRATPWSRRLDAPSSTGSTRSWWWPRWWRSWAASSPSCWCAGATSSALFE